MESLVLEENKEKLLIRGTSHSLMYLDPVLPMVKVDIVPLSVQTTKCQIKSMIKS